jgi:hypothetical protein
MLAVILNGKRSLLAALAQGGRQRAIAGDEAASGATPAGARAPKRRRGAVGSSRI